MDVGQYGPFAVQQLFPALERSQLLLTASHFDEPGRVPHAMPGDFACCDVDPKDQIDLVPQFVLAVWRDVLWTGDRTLALRLWPQVGIALERYGGRDANHDGLPDNCGPDQTYDQFPMRGTSAYVGFLHAAALRAAAELAEWAAHPDGGTAYRQQAAAALDAVQRQLWNGTSYRLCFDAGTGDSGEGVMAAQLNGDWFVRQTTGCGLVDDANATSALGSVLRSCLHPAGFVQNCSWPNRRRREAERSRTDQAGRPWTGVEYTLAAHLALLGMRREARGVARLVWERQEHAGLRFNHIECGGYYYRALSFWALHAALAGVLPCVGGDGLRIARRRAGSRFVLTAGTGWGVVTFGRSSLSISVRAGTVRLRRIMLNSTLIAVSAAHGSSAFRARSAAQEMSRISCSYTRFSCDPVER